MERPVSIVWFERCYLGCIAAGLINVAVSWNGNVAKMADNPATAQFGQSFLPAVMLGSTVISVAISLLLWYFTARKASVVTKWIVTVFFVLALLAFISGLVSGTYVNPLSGVLAVVVIVLEGIAVWHLFKPDAKIWFGETKV